MRQHAELRLTSCPNRTTPAPVPGPSPEGCSGTSSCDGVRDPATAPRVPPRPTVVLHELAQHAGQADILPEQSLAGQET
jgi:hypothetical protein